MNDKRGLFADASRTLFGVGFLIFIVATCQDNVLGSSEILKEQDELRKRCEVFEQQNSNVEK